MSQNRYKLQAARGKAKDKDKGLVKQRKARNLFRLKQSSVKEAQARLSPMLQISQHSHRLVHLEVDWLVIRKIKLHHRKISRIYQWLLLLEQVLGVTTTSVGRAEIISGQAPASLVTAVILATIKQTKASSLSHPAGCLRNLNKSRRVCRQK